MHSLKNTFVAVLLLGASFGVYQAITAPDTTIEADADLLNPLQIEEGTLAMPANGSGTQAKPPTSGFPKLQNNLGNAQKLPPRVGDSNDNSFSGSFDSQFGEAGTRSTTSNENGVRQVAGSSSGTAQNNIGLTGEVSGESRKPDDYALISALKNQLESPNTGTFQPSPSGQMVAMAPRDSQPNSGNAEDSEFDAFDFVERNRHLTTEQLIATWPEVQKTIELGNYRDALASLSRFYHSDSIVGPQRQKLMGWLNALAGKVIYSTEHNMFNNPYVIQPNQQLSDLSEKWDVTPQLIYNINQKTIANPSELIPGTEVKVVMGPFHAQVDTSDETLTLFVKNLYAGQFKVFLNRGNPLPTGIQRIAGKTSNASVDQFSNLQVQIELENRIVLSTAGENPPQGVISLSEKDAQDLFTILTQRSKVSITK